MSSLILSEGGQVVNNRAIGNAQLGPGNAWPP